MHLAQRSSLLTVIGTLIWALVILVLSAWPGQQLPKVEWLLAPDKFAHASVYGILAAAGFFSWRDYVPASDNGKYYWPFLLASSYGAAMEWMQYRFFPGRYFEFWDIVANISGAFVALLILRKIYH